MQLTVECLDGLESDGTCALCQWLEAKDYFQVDFSEPYETLFGSQGGMILGFCEFCLEDRSWAERVLLMAELCQEQFELEAEVN